MNKNDIFKNVSGAFGKVGFKLKKHSPEILVGVGVAGTVASAVMACKATTKIGGILEKTKEDVDTIHKYAGDDSLGEPYSDEDAKKDLALVYIQTGIKIAKLYGPSLLVGVVSITSILASNNILRKRNIAIAAAYTAIDKSFKEYRNRVIDRFGEEIERELKYNIKSKKFEEITIDEKTGKEKKTKTDVQIAELDGYSDYARFFDEASPCWEKDSEYNLTFLRAQQRYANDLLIARGRLFLNEVYDMLGIPRTKAGQVVGWVYDANNPIGDNYVDFGMYDVNREKVRDFVNGYERVILLDFNVDGNIWDLM